MEKTEVSHVEGIEPEICQRKCFKKTTSDDGQDCILTLPIKQLKQNGPNTYQAAMPHHDA